MDSIHVCFALHDAQGHYSKYLGIAVMSLFEQTDSKVCVHILCDNTVSKMNKERFEDLAKKYGQAIVFYRVDKSKLSPFKKRIGNFSIGTLFRIQIADILPYQLQRIIYLDDDLLVNMDVRELWEIDLTNYILGACRDPGIPFLKELPYPCVAGWVSAENYFNAGVMVINLMKLRHIVDFSETCIDFLAKNPECSMLDQDIFNVFFKDQIFYLPRYCNLFSRLLRQEADVPCRGICHISGDYINSEQPYWFDRLFFEYWKHSPWSVGSQILPYFLVREERHARQILLWQKIATVFASKQHPFVIWGVVSILFEKLQIVCPAIMMPDWYVDSDRNLHRKVKNGIAIKAPESLENYSESTKPFVVVMSRKYYHDISLKLTEYGYQENHDYWDGGLLLLQGQGGEFSGY